MSKHKCTRCNDEDFRIDGDDRVVGYCSIYCRDMAEVEDELKRERQLRQQAEAELERVTADWKREMARAVEMEQVYCWTPIAERLPEHDQDVIVRTVHVPSVRMYKFYKGKFYGWGQEDRGVSHWMALPDVEGERAE